MPPRCEICQKDFDPDEEGALVYFRKTDTGEKFETEAKENGFVGHPGNAAWFCGEHIVAARELVHLTLDEAVGSMK